MVMCSTEKGEVSSKITNAYVKTFYSNVVKSRVIIWACGACIALDVWHRFVWGTTGRVMLRNYLLSVTSP